MIKQQCLLNKGELKIQDIIKQLNDTGILDLIAIIISPIISFTILFFTLRHDKKQFKIHSNRKPAKRASREYWDNDKTA